VKTVCTFIGAQAMIDVKQHGGRNPLVEMAQSISITGDQAPEEIELDRIRGPRVADRLEDDPRFARVAADPAAGVEAENAAGSYEQLLAAFAGPPPVPGRE
jgi:hypothetical protein